MNFTTKLHIATLNLKDRIDFAIATSNFAKSRAAGDNDEVKKNKSSKNKKAANTTANTATKSEKAVVGEIKEAAMSGGGHIKDDDPNTINFGFGVKIDMNKMTAPDSNTQIPTTPNQPQFVPQPVEQPHPAQQAYDNAFSNYLDQQRKAAEVAVGRGNHKIDNPMPPKPPIIKSEPDAVNVDLDGINIESNPPKPPRQWPDVVSGPLPQTNFVPPVEEPIFDNSALINKYKYLGDIEKIALENNVQVQFLERAGADGNPNGLISCISYTEGSSKPNIFKGFTIDTGVIIDKRAKVFPAIKDYGYEDLQAYPVLIPKPEDSKGKSKSKNVINEQLFNDLFKGGVNMLGPKGMYTPEYRELNKCVAMITMPTNNMNSDTRKATRDRLMDAMAQGVFANALEHDPNSRFMFKSYDKKTGCFTLTNQMVPFRFGGPYLATKNIEINFGIGETKVSILS